MDWQLADRNKMWRDTEQDATALSSQTPTGQIAEAQKHEGNPRMKQLAAEWEVSRWSLTVTPASSVRCSTHAYCCWAIFQNEAP